MAAGLLTNTQACNAFWQRCVLANLRYWQDYLAQNPKDVTALEREWEGIIKAISFGLDLKEGWPLTYQLIIKFSDFMERRGYWDTWHIILRHALEIAPHTGDEAGQVTLSALSARLWQRQGNHRQMVADYRLTINLARHIKDRFNEGRALTNLGYFYLEQGYWYRAEVLCCHALRIFEQINSDHGLAHTENHLGLLYFRQGIWDKARAHLEQACAIWQKMDDHHGLMRGNINLGILFNETDRPAEGLSYLRKALSQAQLVGEEATIGTIYMDMGNSLRKMGELIEAETHYRKAIAIFQQFSDSVGLSMVLDNLGLLFVDQQKWHRARVNFKTSLKNWRDFGNKVNEFKTITFLIELEMSKGDYHQAENWLKEGEKLLAAYDQTKQFHHLHSRLNQLRRSLTG